MARIKGDKPYGLQFESTVQADLDARKEIPLLADLTTANTWTALNGAPNHYVGMTTFCLENKTRYELLGDYPTDIGNWRVMGGGSNTAYDFKASDYVTDKTNATAGLQAMFDDVAKSELEMPNVLIEAGHYVVDNFIKALNKNFNLTAKGATIDGSMSGLVYDSIEFHGIFQVGTTDNIDLTTSVDITQGSNSITLSDVANVSVGDILLLQDTTEGSFVAGVDEYQGEMLVIETIEGNIVSSSNQVRHTYPAAACNIIRTKSVTVNVDGLKVIAPDAGEQRGVLAFFARNCNESLFENIEAIGSNWGNVVLENCRNCAVVNPRVNYASSNNIELNYGIVVNASENIVIDRAFTKTLRHSITFGSAPLSRNIVSRNCVVVNSVVDTYGSDNTPAMDCHEACENMLVVNNPYINGLTFRCKTAKAYGNNIYSDYGGRVVELIGLAAGVFELSNNEFSTNTTASNATIINYSNTNNASAIVQGGVIIRDNKANLTKATGSKYFLSGNATFIEGATPPFYIVSNNVVDFGSVQGVLTSINGNASSILIDKNITDGRVTTGTALRGVLSYIVSGNTFMSFLGEKMSANTMLLQRNVNLEATLKVIEISNNTFINFNEDAIYSTNNCIDILFKDNTFINCSAPFGMLRFVKDNADAQAISTTLHMLRNYMQCEVGASISWMYQAQQCTVIADSNTSSTPKDISRNDTTIVTKVNVLDSKPDELSEDYVTGVMYFDTTLNIPVWLSSNNTWVNANGEII